MPMEARKIAAYAALDTTGHLAAADADDLPDLSTVRTGL